MNFHPPSKPPSTFQIWCGVFFVLVALIVALLIVTARREERFREVSDGAILEISTVEALEGKHLLGPYSRFGWNHPGPLFFYWEGPWYAASGFHTAGMQAGALALNLMTIGAIGWLCLRRLPPIVGASISTLITAYVFRVPNLLVSVWNPHIIVLPMIAVTMLIGVFAETGERPLLLAGIAGGSFLVQTHVAMAPLVALLGLVALISQRRVVVSMAPLAAALAFVLWLPPIVQQLTQRPGNMTELGAFFLRGAHQTQTAAEALDAWAGALTQFAGPIALAMGANLEPQFVLWRVVAAVFAVGVLTVLGARKVSRGLVLTALAATLVALAAVLRISGQIVDHEVFWMSALGVLDASVIVGAAAQAVFDRKGLPTSAFRNGVVSAAIIVVLALSTMAMRDAVERPRTLDDHAVDAITADLQRALSELGARRPLVRIEPGIGPIAVGALLQIYKAHQRFAVETDWVHVLGRSFRENGREDAVVTIGGTVAAPRVSAAPRRMRF